MKAATSTESLKSRQRRAERGCRVPQRECLPLRDLTDCLLQAYDQVAHRAYEIFLGRDEQPGGELEDWLIAERELLSELQLDFDDSGEFVRVLGSVPGFTGEEILIGIEPHWLLVLARHESGDNSDCAPDQMPMQMFCVLELPAEVDPARSIAVLSNGLLGIRMPKTSFVAGEL